MTEDMRRNPRVPLDADVEIDHDGKVTTGRAQDISLGGMFVHTEALVPFGANVTLRFRIRTDALAIPGVIRWTRDGGMGIQFGAIGARETYAITEHVKG